MKGLCYDYDEEFIPGHRCIKPQLFAIENIEVETSSNTESEPEKAILEVSLHAIKGTNQPLTLRLPRKMKGHEFTILIDSESTHNFVD